MITLALDTATDRCSVAATDGTRVVERQLDGARQHARAVLGLADALLAELGATPRDVQRMLTADGPGSFTGLRVAASVAKGLAWAGRIEWRVAPSLLVRAAGHAPAGGGIVLALSDALRGDLYAGAQTSQPSWFFMDGYKKELRREVRKFLRPLDFDDANAVRDEIEDYAVHAYAGMH